MNREEIKDIIIEVVSQLLIIDKDKIKEESSLVEDLHADSLDAIDIIMTIEDRFDLSISNEEAEMATNVKFIINCIEKKLK